jgi:hypothetical protein
VKNRFDNLIHCFADMNSEKIHHQNDKSYHQNDKLFYQDDETDHQNDK